MNLLLDRCVCWLWLSHFCSVQSWLGPQMGSGRPTLKMWVSPTSECLRKKSAAVVSDGKARVVFSAKRSNNWTQFHLSVWQLLNIKWRLGFSLCFSQLARRGFNIVLISRTQQKLDEISKAICEYLRNGACFCLLVQVRKKTITNFKVVGLKLGGMMSHSSSHYDVTNMVNFVRSK